LGCNLFGYQSHAISVDPPIGFGFSVKKKKKKKKKKKIYNSLGKQNFFSILAKQVKDHSKFSRLAKENSNGRVLLFLDSGSSPFTK
jgi:hypothetical protein